MDYLKSLGTRQPDAYRLVAEGDRLKKKRHRAANEQIINAVRKRPVYEVGQWMWVYDDQHTLATAVGDKGADALAVQRRIKGKLANEWVGPCKVLGVGPCEVEGHCVGPKLSFLDMPYDKTTNPRVSVLRCKRCILPHEERELPRYLPWNLSAYVLICASHIII